MKNPLQNLPVRAVRLALGALAFIVPIAVAQSQNAVSASGENCLTVECESSQITNACGQPVNFAVCHAADHKGCLFALGKTTPPIGAGETLPFACVAGKIPKVGGCFPPFVPASVSRAEHVCLPDPDNPESSAASAGQPAPVLAAATEPPPTRESPPEKTATERLLESELNPFWTDENEWTQLHWAAAADDGEAVRRLLELGAALNITDKGDGSDFSDQGNKRFKLLGKEQDGWKNTGDTPLVVAVGFNSAVAVSVLLANGAEVNAKGKDGRTPLHVAAGDNRAEIAKLLIDKGANIEAKDKDGRTPLHRAAYRNAAEVAKLLIDNGAKAGKGIKISPAGIRKMERVLNTSPLHLAVFHNDLEQVRSLIESENINKKIEGIWSPLEVAVLQNNLSMVKLLVDQGADIDMPSVFPAACYLGDLELVQFFIERGADANKAYKGTCLHRASQGINLEVIQFLVERKRVDINSQKDTRLSDKGWTPLMLLVSYGFPRGEGDSYEVNLSQFYEAFRFLVNQGADVRTVDSKGRTILHILAERDRTVDLTQDIVSKGLSMNVQDKEGQTPLHVAAQNSLQALQSLIDLGADVNIRDNNGKTPLHLAVQQNEVMAAQILIARKADVNTKAENGVTPLHTAAGQNAAGIAKLLVANGAEVNAKDKDGATPLHWANGVESTKALIEGGAEVNVKDGKGETPLDAAIGDGNDEMQSFLRQHGGRCKGFLGYKKC